MGYPMAGHLARAGHDVTVYNRTAAKADAVGRRSTAGASAPTPAAAARGRRDRADVRRQRRRRARGRDGRGRRARRHGGRRDPRRSHDGVGGSRARGARGGAGAQASASSTRRSRAARRAPRTASSRSWSAATPTSFARAESVLAHYARAVTLMGGAGQPASSPRWSTRSASPASCRRSPKGIDFAMRAGLDAERVLDVISKGAAQSWQMENRGKTMVADKFDFGFAVDWMRKDLGDLPRRSARATARRCRSPRWSTSSTRGCRRAAAAAGTRRASSGCCAIRERDAGRRSLAPRRRSAALAVMLALAPCGASAVDFSRRRPGCARRPRDRRRDGLRRHHERRDRSMLVGRVVAGRAGCRRSSACATIGEPATERSSTSLPVAANATTRLAYLGDHLLLADLTAAAAPTARLCRSRSTLPRRCGAHRSTMVVRCGSPYGGRRATRRSALAQVLPGVADRDAIALDDPIS